MRLFLLLILALGIGGCALFGVHTDPTTGQATSDGKGGIVGTVANFAGLPWVGTAIAALAGVYVEAKRRGWKAAALSTFDAVEKWKAENPSVWAGLKEKLGAAHAEAKIKAMVDKALGNT